MTYLTVYEANKETTEQRRRRLATEIQLIKEQFNSKLAECLDEGLDIDIGYKSGESISDELALIATLDCSYQTKRKFYR